MQIIPHYKYENKVIFPDKEQSIIREIKKGKYEFIELDEIKDILGNRLGHQYLLVMTKEEKAFITNWNGILGKALGIDNFKMYWFQQIMFLKVREILEQNVLTRKTKFLIIECPFRMGKTMLTAGAFVPYIYSKNPSQNSIYTTFSDGKASTTLRQYTLRTMNTPIYVRKFNKMLKSHLSETDRLHIKKYKDSMAILKSEGYFGEIDDIGVTYTKGAETSQGFQTIQGGTFVAGSPRTVLGQNADLLIADDFYSPDVIHNPSQQDSLLKNYISSVFSREDMLKSDDNTLFILTGTRWSSIDPIGYIKDLGITDKYYQDVTETLTFRFLKESDDFEYDPRREGEPLSWKGANKMLMYKNEPHIWVSALQQRPEDVATQSLAYEDFVLNCDLPKTINNLWVSVDTSYNTSKKSDKVAIGLFGRGENKEIYVIDIIYEKLGSTETCNKINKLVTKWGAVYGTSIPVLIELKSAGGSVLEILTSKKEGGYGWPRSSIKTFIPTTSKMSRLQEVVHIIKSHKLHIVKGILPYYRSQLLKFTGKKGQIDDLVDITTQYLKKVKINNYDATNIHSFKKKKINSFNIDKGAAFNQRWLKFIPR